MASSSLTLKGWFLKGCSSDSGISRTFSSLASWRLSSVENKSSYGASSTFFALLFKFYHLLGQILVALGHLAIRVMGKNAFALGANFLCPDRMGNLGAEHLDFAAVGFSQQGGDLLGEVGSVVHHRQQYTVDLELGVDLPLHLIYGLEQLFQALGGQILRLNGDYDPVGGGQGVDREHTQGWLAVNQDMGILSLERIQILPQDGLTAHGIHQGDLHTGELDVGGHQVNPLWVVQDTLARAQRLVHQNTAHSVRQCKGQLVRLGVAQADGQAALRVSVDQQHFLSGLGQPDPQVRAGGCLANAAFLVGDGDDLRVQINLLLLQKISLFRKIGMKKAAYSNK